MAMGFRSLSKSAFLGLTIAALVSLTPRPAMAQFMVFDPSSYAAMIDYTTDFLTTMAEQMFDTDQNSSKLAATITNNATTSNAFMAKGFDKLSTDQHVREQQVYQANASVENATGAASYMRGNLCQQTTLQAGRSSMRNAMMTELATYNTYRGYNPTLTAPASTYDPVGGSGTTTCGGNMCGYPSPPGLLNSEFTPASPGKKVQNWITAMKGFYGAAEGASDKQAWQPGSTGYNATDTMPATHLDVDAIGLSIVPVYTDVVRMAHDMFANYILGMQPDVVSPSAFTTNPAGLSSALIASHEKLAYYNLAALPWAEDRAYHGAVTTGAAPSVTAIYKSANMADPTFKNGVSYAALDQALYSEPADDPNFAANLSSQNAKTLLEFLGQEMMLMNNMEYKRYQQEQENAKLLSAQLALQMRSFDFGSHE